jgi:hypothetical protein
LRTGVRHDGGDIHEVAPEIEGLVRPHIHVEADRHDVDGHVTANGHLLRCIIDDPTHDAVHGIVTEDYAARNFDLVR